MSGVGPQTTLGTIAGDAAPKLKKAWGIRTVGELLDRYPRTYLDPTRPTDFRSVTTGERVVLVARVARAVTRSMRSRKGRMLVVQLEDDKGGRLEVVFFRAFGHTERLVPGARIVCTGVINDRRQITHPDYQVIDEESSTPSGYREGPIPVYRDGKGLTSMMIASVMDLALHALTEAPDPIPEQVRAEHKLPDLLETYRLIHQPRTERDHHRGRWRMKWQEAFVIQAALAQRRRSARAIPATPRPGLTGGLADAFEQRLPFDFTPGQERVVAEVRGDLDRATPMNRLLQGEVGSGKTVVALAAMLTVIDSGGQAALLAPTEVLATQHYRSITSMLGPLAEGGLLGGAEDGTRVALLTGSQSAAERKANLLLAASGEAGIVVGTHALIQEHVQFADLAMAVVDEQHRFGVEQRDALRAKARAITLTTPGSGGQRDGAGETDETTEMTAAPAPHVLVMTATPIPRTVAMTVFGDMETSVLDELPRGRQPITTHVVSGGKPRWVQRMWERVAEEVAGGGQVYVVCPRIGEEDDPDLPAPDLGPGVPIPASGADAGDEQSDEPGDDVGLIPVDAGADGDAASSRPMLHGVIQTTRALKQLAATSGLRIEMVHGRMPAEDKDRTMRAFAAGEVDVLVATTVIEVGVDVPNATQMVILDADRFGVSQLHQLRGRVGRGTKPGLCLLVTQSDPEVAPERLEAIAATTDGFELARLDLELRQEGDVLGATQSGGRSSLRMLRLTRDEDLIVAAHDAAWSTIEEDPELDNEPALAAELARLDADRAAYLERG